jgi:hypothetical protein
MHTEIWQVARESRKGGAMYEWLVLMLGSALGYRGFDPVPAVVITAALLTIPATKRDLAGTGGTITLALASTNAALFGAASYFLGRVIAWILAA